MVRHPVRPMYVIIQTRELQLKDLQYARLLKPYLDADLVMELPPGRAEIEFLVDMVNDKTQESEMFEHLLTKTHPNMMPSEIYQHLKDRDDHIPTLYIANYVDDRFRAIRKVERHQELQSLLSVLASRGLVEGVDHLI